MPTINPDDQPELPKIITEQDYYKITEQIKALGMGKQFEYYKNKQIIERANKDQSQYLAIYFMAQWLLIQEAFQEEIKSKIGLEFRNYRE